MGVVQVLVGLGELSRRRVTPIPDALELSIVRWLVERASHEQIHEAVLVGVDVVQVTLKLRALAPSLGADRGV